MDKIDRKILNIIQDKFPLSSRPYNAVGKKLKLSENEVFERVKRLKKEKIIRRIGATFDSRRLGWKTILAAIRVNPENLNAVAETVSAYDEVTHNYQRDHTYNIWFTLTCPNKKAIDKIINKIQRTHRSVQIRLFPAKKIFKLKTDFKL